jgi:hypothetical protein
MEILQLEIEDIAKKIEEICVKGLLKAPINFPSSIANSYNRVLIEAGEIVGWVDKEKMTLDSELLISKIGSTLNVYKTASENIKLTSSEEILNYLSPVFVIESIINRNVEGKLNACHIFSTLAIYNIWLFYEFCREFIDDEEFEENHHNLLCLCNAQSHLLIAQEAINKANIYYYEATYADLSKLPKEERSALLTIAADKGRKSNAGKKSIYDPIYNWAISESSKRWKKEKSEELPITRIGKMAENLITDFKEQFPEHKKITKAVEIESVKNKIRFIANKIAPEACKGGRPKL